MLTQQRINMSDAAVVGHIQNKQELIMRDAILSPLEVYYTQCVQCACRVHGKEHWQCQMAPCGLITQKPGRGRVPARGAASTDDWD